MIRKLKIQKSKFKITIQKSKILKTFSFLLALLTLNFYLLTSVYAVDSSPSADIKTKLEELKKEIASKAAKLKQEVNRKLQNKAYVGKVKIKTTTSLTLASRTGPKIVNLNQDTIYESLIKTKQKFSLKSLAEEADIAALGDVDDNGVLTAKKIVLLPTTNLPPKTYLWGQIMAISDGLITIKNRDLKNVAISKTLAEVKGDPKLNDFVIVTGSLNKNEILEAEFIYVIPKGGILKPKKTVYPAPTGAGTTPSGQIKTATPAAKPKSAPR